LHVAAAGFIADTIAQYIWPELVAFKLEICDENLTRE